MASPESTGTGFAAAKRSPEPTQVSLGLAAWQLAVP